jgi:predicted phosphoribosyltransferase
LVDIIEDDSLRNQIHVYEDRIDAGDVLVNHLKEYENKKQVIILGIPAGGVPVAIQISKKLNIIWDLILTRKLHIPWNKEAGFGAVSWEGTIILNKPLVDSLGLTNEEINNIIENEKKIIHNRLKKFRGNKPFPNLSNKTVIIVDDGLASGFSMLVTAKAIKKQKVKKIVVAIPTAPISAIKLVSFYANKIVCPNIRSGSFFAVAEAYKKWSDLTDNDVLEIIKIK